MNANGGAVGLHVRGSVRRRARPTGLRAISAYVGAWTPAVAAFLLSIGALLGGFNSLLGQAAGYLVNAALLILLLFVYQPTRYFWVKVAPVLLLCAAAALWVWLVSRGVQMVPGSGPPVVFARDLFGPEMLGFLAGVLALLAGALMGHSPGTMSPFLRWVLIFNAAWIVWGLTLRVSNLDAAFDLWTVTRQGRFTGTIGNANVTAALAGALAIIAAGMMLGQLRPGRARQPQRIALSAGAFLLFMGTVFATASRSAAFSAIVLLLVLVVNRVGARARGRVSAATMRRVLIIMLTTGVIILMMAGALLMDRLSSVEGDFGDRLTMWGHYAELAGKAPYYGYGLGAFPSLNTHFLSTVEMAQAVWNVNSAHNIVLQLLLNGGVPYFAFLLLGFALVGATILPEVRREGWPIGQVAPLLALVHIMACAMVDICLDVPAVTILFLGISGILWGRAIRKREGAVQARDVGGRPVQGRSVQG